MRVTLVALSAASLLTLACAGASMVGPSPLIVPDAATIRPGDAQVFTVMNATVARFALAGEAQAGSACVAIDATFDRADGIRLIARRACERPVYVSADIGRGRSPLIAVIRVQ